MISSKKKITKRKAKEAGDEPISFRSIQEVTIQTIPTPPTTFSPRKYRLSPRNDVISTPQYPKNLQVAKSELKEVIHLI